MDSHPSPRVARDAPRLIQDVIADPGAIRIVTQPILDLVDGRIAGYEALSRFDRRIGWSPQHWFQCAQRCGLGARLEAAAIDAALSVPFRPPATVLTVNVSPSTLGTRALGEVLPGDLSGLMFELTENEPISGDPSLPATIRNYRRRGARFALDDVGAGHARLADVRLVEPELIKLDRSLIAGLELDPVRAAAADVAHPRGDVDRRSRVRGRRRDAAAAALAAPRGRHPSPGLPAGHAAARLGHRHAVAHRHDPSGEDPGTARAVRRVAAARVHLRPAVTMDERDARARTPSRTAVAARAARRRS